tara:strand:- start:1071 stop:1907 length:837 start_codon:yes stop_codon:yes gene_type:complete
MQTLVLEKKKIDLREFVQRRANESDCATLLKDEFRVVDKETGKVVCLYIKPREDADALSEIFDCCTTVKYQETFRTSGLKTTSRIFGYNPRNAIRKDFCSITSFATEQPNQHAKIMSGGAIAAKHYALHNSELYSEHLKTTKERIVEDYRHADVPFTSGIINDNNPLCYHFDSGNFKDVWSAMIVLKKEIGGGYLSMPEYGVMCEVKDKSIFYFDGQSILHGVTPITKMRPDSRRFSIVYYSLRAMWNCTPLREEIARARMRREQVENRRLSGKPVKT